MQTRNKHEYEEKAGEHKKSIWISSIRHETNEIN